jgi:site-specific recombinase XerD
MASVNFYLKKAEPKSGLSLIYLQFTYAGKKLVHSTGESIDRSHWNEKKQRVKSNSQTTADSKHSLNDLLDHLKLTCERTYNQEKVKGIPDRSIIKDALIQAVSGTSSRETVTLKQLIEKFIANEVRFNGKGKQLNTIKTYRTTLNHLLAFERERRYPVTYESINMDFHNKYTSYLESINLSINSIGKDIKNIKTFMNAASDFGYTDNEQFKKKRFCVPKEPTYSVALKEQEVLRLYQHDFSGNRRLEQVRDLFVLGCFTGLRYSDITDIKRENIIRENGRTYIARITKKTDEPVTIPCNEIVEAVLRKYQHTHNSLPPQCSNQKFNEYIKELCELAGLNEIGRLITDQKAALHTLVSSHTMRRTWCTVYYLKGANILDLMKISGHRSQRSFELYVKSSTKDVADRVRNIMEVSQLKAS